MVKASPAMKNKNQNHSRPATRFSKERLILRVAGYQIKHKLSAAGVARVCFPTANTAPQILHNLMCGAVSAPDYDTLERLAKGLGCKIADLREPTEH